MATIFYNRLIASKEIIDTFIGDDGNLVDPAVILPIEEKPERDPDTGRLIGDNCKHNDIVRLKKWGCTGLYISGTRPRTDDTLYFESKFGDAEQYVEKIMELFPDASFRYDSAEEGIPGSLFGVDQTEGQVYWHYLEKKNVLRTPSYLQRWCELAMHDEDLVSNGILPNYKGYSEYIENVVYELKKENFVVVWGVNDVTAYQFTYKGCLFGVEDRNDEPDPDEFFTIMNGFDKIKGVDDVSTFNDTLRSIGATYGECELDSGRDALGTVNKAPPGGLHIVILIDKHVWTISYNKEKDVDASQLCHVIETALEAYAPDILIHI